MEVIDAVLPGPYTGEWVPTTDQQVACVQAQPDVTHLQGALDLPNCLEVSAGVVVQRRLIAALAATLGDLCNPFAEPPPARLVPTQAVIPSRRAGPAPPFGRAGVGQRWLRTRPGVGYRVEDVQQRLQTGHVCLEIVVAGERECQVAAGQPQVSFAKPGPELAATSEVAGRTEVDSGVPGAGDLVEHGQRPRHVGIVEGDLERAVAARCVGDRDARLAPLWMLQLSPPAAGRWGPRAYATAQSLNKARHRANRPCRQCVGCAR